MPKVEEGYVKKQCLGITISPDLHEEIKDVADEENISVTSLVTRLIKEYLKKRIPSTPTLIPRSKLKGGR